MPYSLEALAKLVGGKVDGDGKIEIKQARPVTDAGPGDITFIEDERHAKQLRVSSVAAAVVSPDFALQGIPLIRVAKPIEAFTAIVTHLQGPQRQRTTGVHPGASIAPSAKIGRDPSIQAFAVIGEDVTIGDRCQIMPGAVIGDGCSLGDDCIVHPHVVLYPGTVLGSRVIVHAGSVLGADGFGYRPENGRHTKMPQLGRVEVGDDVEIGANTTIDRGTFHVTRIGEGTKIDNLVQIAHNCQIGRHNLIVGQVGIAGSCKTGDYVVIAGQAGIKDHITIGDRAVLGGMSGVMRDIPPGERWVGVPATPEREQYRVLATLHRLPELRDRIATLAKRLDEMEHVIAPKKKSA